jgi:hypothetical protein
MLRALTPHRIPGRVDEGNAGKYIVRLAVRDTEGAGVEGAAVYVREALYAARSLGNCFIRAAKGRSMALGVATDGFTAPGRWQAVAAPATPTPALNAISIAISVTRLSG